MLRAKGSKACYRLSHLSYKESVTSQVQSIMSCGKSFSYLSVYFNQMFDIKFNIKFLDLCLLTQGNRNKTCNAVANPGSSSAGQEPGALTHSCLIGKPPTATYSFPLCQKSAMLFHLPLFTPKCSGHGRKIQQKAKEASQHLNTHLPSDVNQNPAVEP